MSLVKTLFRRALPPLISIVLIYAALLYLGNRSVLVVSMHEASGAPLSPRIYYADTTHIYAESRSASPFKREGDRYYFAVPDPSQIAFLRIDPDTKAGRDIRIDRIDIERRSWFRIVRMMQPLTSLTPLHHVDRFVSHRHRVAFRTVGNDPFVETPFTPKLTASVRLLPLSELIAALLLYLLVTFLYRLSRNGEHDETQRGKLILYALFLGFLLFKGWYYKEHIRFGYPPDEGAHLSYIAHVHEHHAFFPSFETMTMLNNKKAGNYLSHPPLYYELANLVYDDSLSAKANADRFRTLSFALYAAAVFLLLYLGFRAGLGLLGDFVYLAVLASVPMFAYTGGSISNDTLAFVGAAVFLVGFADLLRERYDTRTWAWVIGGGLIAYFSKLTAALLLFFALGYFLIVQLLKHRFPSVPRTVVWMAAVAAVPVLLYQGYIIWHYHALVPTFNHTHPQEYLHSPFFVPEPYRQHLTPLAWAERMWHYIQGGWFGIHSHHSFTKASVSDYAGLLLLHIAAIAALFLPCKSDLSAFCRLGKYTLAALLSVLAVQYGFSYKAHLASGYMGGLQPRYLLPFMVAFAIMASILAERFKAHFWWSVAVVAVTIHAIYSDFFYFLLYYR